MPSHPESLTHPSLAGSFPSTSTQSAWEPVHLSPAHVEMIKQWVQGIPKSRIAYNFKRFGVRYSQRQIQRVINSEKGVQFASLYSAQLHGGIAGLTHEAAMYAPEAFYSELEVLRNPLTGDRHKLAAAADIMDRTGPIKISRTEVTNQQPTTIVVNLLPSQVSQFLAAPPVVETEVVLLPNPRSSSNDD